MKRKQLQELNDKLLLQVARYMNSDVDWSRVEQWEIEGLRLQIATCQLILQELAQMHRLDDQAAVRGKVQCVLLLLRKMRGFGAAVAAPANEAIAILESISWEGGPQ